MEESGSDITTKSDAIELKDISPESLSSVFKNLVECHNDALKNFRPTLSALNKAIHAFHEIGLDGISLEYGDLDKLQKLSLYRQNDKDEEPDVTYAVLGIYDAQFLVRIHPDNVIDCHAVNLNMPATRWTNNISSDFFWYKRHEDSTLNKSVPEFFQYDLTVNEDRIAFANTVLQTAAVCVAMSELKEYDVTSSRHMSLPKSATASHPKIK